MNAEMKPIAKAPFMQEVATARVNIWQTIQQYQNFHTHIE